jgi:hypothetical protein
MRFPTISLITLAASGAAYYVAHQPQPLPPAPPPAPTPVAAVTEVTPQTHTILDAPKDKDHHSMDDLSSNK